MPQDVPVQAVQTSYRILEALMELGGAGPVELANWVDLAESTVHDHLSTLEQLNYVTNENGQYMISTRYLELGIQLRNRIEIYKAGKGEINRLAAETGEHSVMMIEENGLGVMLHLARGDNAVSINPYPGIHVKLHTSAMGECILAYLPDERVAEIVEQYGLEAEQDEISREPGELEDRLSAVRDEEYTVGFAGDVEGVRCVAKPILSNGTVYGSIGVCGPKNRIIAENNLEDIGKELLQAADVIQVNLAHSDASWTNL